MMRARSLYYVLGLLLLCLLLAICGWVVSYIHPSFPTFSALDAPGLYFFADNGRLGVGLWHPPQNGDFANHSWRIAFIGVTLSHMDAYDGCAVRGWLIVTLLSAAILINLVIIRRQRKATCGFGVLAATIPEVSPSQRHAEASA